MRSFYRSAFAMSEAVGDPNKWRRRRVSSGTVNGIAMWCLHFYSKGHFRASVSKRKKDSEDRYGCVLVAGGKG
jgi:hypothetical protein